MTVNRYNQPHFSDRPLRVSIWIGVAPQIEFPQEYFEENYEDDEKPFSRFAEDFGFGFYDHDFMERNFSDDGPQSICDLLDGHSYSTSFTVAASVAAERLGINKTELTALLYNFEYSPEVTGITHSQYLHFLGCFDYDESALNIRETN